MAQTNIKWVAQVSILRPGLCRPWGTSVISLAYPGTPVPGWLCRPWGTSVINLAYPGTPVPGWLCRPCGTSVINFAYPALPCRAGCAVPAGLASLTLPTRHCRAGLVVPSLRDSPHWPCLPGTPVPGYRLCRPCGTRVIDLGYPALPCRATGCSVPAGLLSLLRFWALC
jgi:hypothetical protein